MSPIPVVVMPSHVAHQQAPCGACPFRRSVGPGALGGSTPETFIGQAFGPFVLPCHQHCDFSNPDWKLDTAATPQCAGAAHFRANVGVRLPDAIYALPPDAVRVFASAEEFLAHHAQCSVEHAGDLLALTTPHELMLVQLARSLTKPPHRSMKTVTFPPVHASTPMFIVGQTYLTRGGRSVTIVAENRRPGYESVQGDDKGEDRGWRYDRDGDRGRVTGSAPGGGADDLVPL